MTVKYDQNGRIIPQGGTAQAYSNPALGIQEPKSDPYGTQFSSLGPLSQLFFDAWSTGQNLPAPLFVNPTSGQLTTSNYGGSASPYTPAPASTLLNQPAQTQSPAPQQASAPAPQPIEQVPLTDITSSPIAQTVSAALLASPGGASGVSPGTNALTKSSGRNVY